MLRHHSRIRGLHKGRYRHGQYIITPDPESVNSLTRWITSGDFTACEDEQFRMHQAQGRPRNILYSFHLPEMQQEVVMKVSHISPRYRLSRKIDLLITSLYKDYCKISFYSAMALHDRNLPIARPLAFWTFRQGFLRKKSYFLCSKLPGKQSIKQLLQSLPKNDLSCDFHAMADKLVAIIKNVHAAGLRHGDLHTGNIYMHAPRPAADEQATKLSDFSFFLVDYDNCSKTRIKTPWVKKIYDLKDLSRLVIPTVRDEELLKMYFDATPSPHSIRIFRFWKNGGINLRQKLGLPPKKENRHLAR